MGYITAGRPVMDAKVGRGTVALLLRLILILAIFAERAPGQQAGPAAQRANPAPLARHVPLKDLVAYLEFDGLDAHAGAWRASALYKILNDTKLGDLLEDLALQGFELIQEKLPLEERIPSAEIVGILKQVARDGFVLEIGRAHV